MTKQLKLWKKERTFQLWTHRSGASVWAFVSSQTAQDIHQTHAFYGTNQKGLSQCRSAWMWSFGAGLMALHAVLDSDRRVEPEQLQQCPLGRLEPFCLKETWVTSTSSFPPAAEQTAPGLSFPRFQPISIPTTTCSHQVGSRTKE